jgi:hypothetical protein
VYQSGVDESPSEHVDVLYKIIVSVCQILRTQQWKRTLRLWLASVLYTEYMYMLVHGMESVTSGAVAVPCCFQSPDNAFSNFVT